MCTSKYIKFIRNTNFLSETLYFTKLECKLVYEIFKISNSVDLVKKGTWVKVEIGFSFILKYKFKNPIVHIV